MKSDSEIKRNVEAELKWDPDIDATGIAVAVKAGVVRNSDHTSGSPRFSSTLASPMTRLQSQTLLLKGEPRNWAPSRSTMGPR